MRYETYENYFVNIGDFKYEVRYTWISFGEPPVRKYSQVLVPRQLIRKEIIKLIGAKDLSLPLSFSSREEFSPPGQYPPDISLSYGYL
jgi:hypothetical protein